MSWTEWILTAATPLILAVSSGKRKPPKPKTARRAQPAPKSRAKKPARRAAPARKPRARVKPTRRAIARKPVPTRARPAPPAPTPATAAPKSADAVPPPKPMPPIGRAILLLPENEKFVDTFHPTFRWLSVGGATRYEIVWGEDPSLTTPRTIFSVATEATVPVEEPLELGKTYYWRVRGGNDSGWSAWSDTFSFHVLEETP